MSFLDAEEVGPTYVSAETVCEAPKPIVGMLVGHTCNVESASAVRGRAESLEPGGSMAAAVASPGQS